MKRTASLLLAASVLYSSAAAQKAEGGRTALPSEVVAAAGQDSDSLLKNPVIQARMKRLLGNRYGSFMESFETLSPVKREGNFLFSSGCLIHACTHLESAIAVDVVNGTIHAAIFRQDEKTRYFNEGGRATPVVIRGWAGNLRRINGAAEVAGTEPSYAPRRLRSRASVRGFVGGESHDGYVIRAREGQTLTVRLSWRREGENRASLNVSGSPDFYSAGPAGFGAEYDDGKGWTGRVPATGDYYVYVVAHPAARYTLRVSVR